MPNVHIESGNPLNNKDGHSCFSLKRKRVALLLIVCLQVPVLYTLFSPEIDAQIQQKWVHFADTALTSRVSNVLRNGSLYIKDWLNSCKNGSCPVTNITLPTNETKPFHNSQSNITIVESTMMTPTLNVTTIKTTTVEPKTVTEIIREATPTEQTVTTTTVTLPQSNSNMSEVIGKNSSGEILPDCPEQPPNLQGNLDISFSNDPASFETIALDNPLGKDGGHYKPPFCKARSKVAVIIPFRNRDQHFKYFLQFMLPTLQRQQLDFRIYIINQFGSGKFNRAKLMNIGYVEALKDYDFECFVFHDVDLILENDKCLYTCPPNPRHLSVGVDKFNYRLPYTAIFGGVTELTKGQFEKVNGYSNAFWGWGGEDDDMYSRVKTKGMQVIRYSNDIARYKMISHQREKGNEANPERFKMIQKTRQTMDSDGLNNLNYKVVSRDLHATYTNITVDALAPN